MGRYEWRTYAARPYLYELDQASFNRDPRRSMIHVCSLARLHETVEDTGARHVVSLIGDEARIERPCEGADVNHGTTWIAIKGRLVKLI